MSKVYLVTGGARSGKSRFAENLAKDLCPDSKRRCYIATAEAFDDEMKERIAKHRERRGEDFLTVESPIELGKAITDAQQKCSVILVDCLTVWMGNLLHYGRLEQKDKLLEALWNAKCDVVLVTNETGMGIVPANDLSRAFRDEAGYLNQEVARVADTVVMMVCGLPMFVKGEI